MATDSDVPEIRAADLPKRVLNGQVGVVEFIDALAQQWQVDSSDLAKHASFVILATNLFMLTAGSLGMAQQLLDAAGGDTEEQHRELMRKVLGTSELDRHVRTSLGLLKVIREAGMLAGMRRPGDVISPPYGFPEKRAPRSTRDKLLGR